MKNWLKSVGIKVIKTMAETALAFLTIGMAIQEIDWLHILSVAVVSGIYTVLFNIKEIQEK